MSTTRLNQQKVDFYVGMIDDLLALIGSLENCGSGPKKIESNPVVAKVTMSANATIGMEYF